MKDLEGIPDRTTDLCGAEKEPLPPISDEQIEFVRETLLGLRCAECGEPVEPTEPCEACSDKRELLRHVFPETHGDA